uniref:OTU domain-containing protein 4 n=1 Tax=Anthurium amnicola TaxID=1678845 RepID=A0A1D1YU11_9ARAE
MMHPYFAATLLVGAVAVAYGAYIIYKEISEEPILLHNTRGREGYQSGEDEDSSVIGSEKNGLRRRRKVKNENNDRNDEEEQELLDEYSYLTALEQEIERKKKQLVDEERILYEKEQEIQNRKQHLLSVSSQSSSNTDNEISPLTTQRKSSISSSVTSASEIFVNDYHDKTVLTEGTLPVTSKPPQSVISVKTVSSDENDQPNNKFSDVAAHTILSQHLSHITHQQQTPDPSVITDTPANSKTIPSLISEQHSYPVNNSHFVAKSIASEETWSEVDSVLSENIGSVMSSAVDIDMEEVDVIEH